MRRSCYGLLSGLLLIACAPAPEEAAVASLSGQVSEMVGDHAMAGVVLVTIDGEPILEEAFNVEPLRADFELTVDSVFAIASLTKSFTAILALRQVEAGRLELDAPVSTYLPGFNASYADDVTVRQLLENSSGIPHYVDIPGWFDPEIKSAFSAESFLDELAALELRFAPGSNYLYSNSNYYLLGLILEAASGASYESLLEQEVLAPLGLEQTGQIYSPGPLTVAPTYLREADAYEQIQVSNTVLFRATASQFSSASDLAAFGNALMNGALLSPEMRAMLFDEERPMGFTITSATLGGKDVPVVTYNGELAGSTSMLTMFPLQNGTIVILSNNNTPYTTLVEMTMAIARLAF